MPLKIGNIELYMGPKSLGGPDDLRQAIVCFIDKAEKRLDIAVQELDNWKIAKAIIRAKQRKVQVRLVLEGDYLKAPRTQANPFKPGGRHEINRDIHNAVLRAAIKVNTDFNSKIFHQKFIIRDGTALLTGSTNFTTTGTENNLNHVVIVHDSQIAQIYSREFREIQKGHFGKLNEGHDAKPPVVNVSDVPIRVLFAPDHNPEMEIMKHMAKTESQIDFAIFTFSQSSGIDDQMIMAEKAGVIVRGALDGGQGNAHWAATRPVQNAGADLFLVHKSGQLGKLHHKLMVLDQRMIIAGSFNYTKPATQLNDENLIMIGNLKKPSEPGVTCASIKAQKQLAAYALTEINRIIKCYGEKLEPDV